MRKDDHDMYAELVVEHPAKTEGELRAHLAGGEIGEALDSTEGVERSRIFGGGIAPPFLGGVQRGEVLVLARALDTKETSFHIERKKPGEPIRDICEAVDVISKRLVTEMGGFWSSPRVRTARLFEDSGGHAGVESTPSAFKGRLRREASELKWTGIITPLFVVIGYQLMDVSKDLEFERAFVAVLAGLGVALANTLFRALFLGRPKNAIDFKFRA